MERLSYLCKVTPPVVVLVRGTEVTLIEKYPKILVASHKRSLFLVTIPIEVYFMWPSYVGILVIRRILRCVSLLSPQALEPPAFSQHTGVEGVEKEHLLLELLLLEVTCISCAHNPLAVSSLMVQPSAREMELVAGEPYPGSKSTLWKQMLKSPGGCSPSVLLSQNQDSNPGSMASESMLLTATLYVKTR